MGLKHYFSKNPDTRAKFIFNLIAPLYYKMDFVLDGRFDISLKKITEDIKLNDKTVLDIGTGTGDWAAMFLKYGAKKVHGIDFAEKMIKKAKQKHNNITFSISNGDNIKEFDENSFDIITASYVMHGMKKEAREEIFTEVKRISKRYFIINDFSGRTPIFLRILETLERSDYKLFKKNIVAELSENFSNVKKYDLGKGHGIYIAEIK